MLQMQMISGALIASNAVFAAAFIGLAGTTKKKERPAAVEQAAAT
jgi:hypothetical protein